MFKILFEKICENGIYIPLCLYLYLAAAIWRVSGFTIYIPLCLYLYINNFFCILSKRNLHSTMFIFISPDVNAHSPFLLIYIPLCLYLYVVVEARIPLL